MLKTAGSWVGRWFWVLALLVLGAGMLHLYPSASLKVLPALYLGPGLLVWLFGRGAIGRAPDEDAG